jgi:hypothetical protein
MAFVSLMRRPPFNPNEDSWHSFSQSLSRRQGHSAAGRVKLIEKSNDLIRNRTLNLPAWGIVPKATKLLRAPI